MESLAPLRIVGAAPPPRASESRSSLEGSDDTASPMSGGTWMGRRCLLALAALAAAAVLVATGFGPSAPSTYDWTAPAWAAAEDVLQVAAEADHAPPVAAEDDVLEIVGAKTILSRGERLCSGGLKHLYHQTSPQACRSILQHGFRRGKPGIFGNGIYFAESITATGRKTRHYGCMIEVLVRLGRVLDLGKGAAAHPPSGEWLRRVGYDSATGVDVSRQHHGREFEIFYPDQIVDMFAYPCAGRWVHGRPPTGDRTGEFIDGKGNFTDSSPPCSPTDYSSKPRLFEKLEA